MSKVISIFDVVPLTVEVLESAIERTQPKEIELTGKEIESLALSIIESPPNQVHIKNKSIEMADRAGEIADILELEVAEKIKDPDVWWNDAYYETYDDIVAELYSGNYKVKNTTIKHKELEDA